MQIIGWDAAAKRIRSWTFDSDGSFAEGSWSKKDNRWYVRKKGTTADGKMASAVNIITLVDDGDGDAVLSPGEAWIFEATGVALEGQYATSPVL